MNNTIAILTLRSIKGLGAVALKKMWQQGIFSDGNHYQIIEKGLLLSKKNITDSEVEELVLQAQNQIERCSDFDVSLVDISSEKYPKQLLELKSPPSVLYYKGNIAKASNAIGIIGTREPDSKGKEIAKRISQYFSEQGFSICNGLAIGIDEACITTGLGTRSNIVGVVAGGLNYNNKKTLLKSTAQLADQVLESGGVLVSEHPIDVKEDTFKVVDSCAIQAGLSNGLIIIQSKANGGSKYTLEAFAELNRPLGVISLAGFEQELLYEANRIILQNPVSGLSIITGLKTEKIKIGRCIPITQKSDYMEFEKSLIIHSKDSNSLPRLF